MHRFFVIDLLILQKDELSFTSDEISRKDVRNYYQILNLIVDDTVNPCSQSKVCRWNILSAYEYVGAE